MPRHLQIAQAFVDEQMAARNDVLAVLVVGSSARGEADETSDVDIAIYVPDARGEGPRDLACWREGVYLEAGVVTPEGLGSLEEVMQNPINATHLRDAAILYDRTGSFRALQAQVRSVFMEPRWLRRRLDWALDYYRSSLARLSEAVQAADWLSICETGMTLPHLASSVPLYLHGLAPSSTRKLYLLKKVCPGLRARLITYECQFPDAEIDGSALLEVSGSCCRAAGRTDLGGLAQYMMWKAERMMWKGDLREAIDVLWTAVGLNIAKPEHQQEAIPYVKEWLTSVGWSTPSGMAGKLRLAQSLLAEIEDMAAAVLRQGTPGFGALE